MKKWEYLTLRAFRGEVTRMNGREPGKSGLFGSRKRPTYPEYLNVLGLEGWEAVGFVLDTPGPEGHAPVEVLLKRALE